MTLSGTEQRVYGEVVSQGDIEIHLIPHTFYCGRNINDYVYDWIKATNTSTRNEIINVPITYSQGIYVKKPLKEVYIICGNVKVDTTWVIKPTTYNVTSPITGGQTSVMVTTHKKDKVAVNNTYSLQVTPMMCNDLVWISSSIKSTYYRNYSGILNDAYYRDGAYNAIIDVYDHMPTSWSTPYNLGLKFRTKGTREGTYQSGTSLAIGFMLVYADTTRSIWQDKIIQKNIMHNTGYDGNYLTKENGSWTSGWPECTYTNSLYVEYISTPIIQSM